MQIAKVSKADPCDLELVGVGDVMTDEMAITKKSTMREPMQTKLSQ